MTEIFRRHSSKFKLIEVYSGGGQSNCSALVGFEDDWSVALEYARLSVPDYAIPILEVLKSEG